MANPNFKPSLSSIPSLLVQGAVVRACGLVFLWAKVWWPRSGVALAVDKHFQLVDPQLGVADWVNVIILLHCQEAAQQWGDTVLIKHNILMSHGNLKILSLQG